ncbi:hypothetical protein KCU61_g3094, partial [Aureobasidium melanogenum]
MDEDLQAPSQLAADIKKASNYLQNLIDTFFSKSEEYEAHHCASRNIYERFQRAHDAVEDHLENTGLVVHMISTDSISMLDDYSRLMTLENKRINRQADFLAQKRVGLTMLDELLGLGEKIMVNHASELKNVNFEIRESLTTAYIQRSFLTLLRSDLKSYILQQSRQANMNDRVHEGDRPVDERDSHHNDTPVIQPDLDAKTRRERATELQSQAYKLCLEKDKVKAEGMHLEYEWYRYNRYYLALKKQVGDAAVPLVLDIGDTAQLQKMSALLALDAQRANAQLAITHALNRICEINATTKKMYLQFAMLLGIDETPEFAKQVQCHQFVFALADTFFLGDSNVSRIMTEPPEVPSAGTEASGSDMSTCNSTFSQTPTNTCLSMQSTEGSTTPAQPETTKNNAEDLDALLAAASDLRRTTKSRISSLLSHLAGHIRSFQKYHDIYHDQTHPQSRAGKPFNLQTMVYHSQKRLEFQALIQETLGQGSQLINKVLVLLGEKAELMGVSIDSDEMREWLDDWAGFRLELDQFQRLLNEAIMERP